MLAVLGGVAEPGCHVARKAGKWSLATRYVSGDAKRASLDMQGGMLD